MRESIVLSMRKGILLLASKYDCKTDEFVIAIADALATVAVALDREVGKQSIEDRLNSFTERVEETYWRMAILPDFSSKKQDAT